MTFDLWSLGFQSVNVLVLIWLLHRFFWKPVAAMVTGREAKVQALLDGARAKAAEAELAIAGIAETRAGLDAERAAMLEAARDEAESARARLLQEAQAEADAIHDTAKSARVRAAETLEESAISDAQGLALTIAGKLLARLDKDSITTAFLGWLTAALAALPEADRRALADARLDLVSATKPDSATQARITQAITQALGTAPDLSFRTDPDLIAGLELQSPHFILRNSWRADLDRITTALRDTDTIPDAA